MALRIDRYRMTDGQTPLAAAYFNPVWQDIDVRLAALEALKIAWADAVAELTRFGLERINVALAPTLEQATDLLDQLLDAAQGFRTEVSEALMAEVQPALDRLANPGAVVVTYVGGVVTEVAEQMPAGERVTTYSYDGQGRIDTATTVFAGVTRVETYMYTGGVLTGMTATEGPTP